MRLNRYLPLATPFLALIFLEFYSFNAGIIYIMLVFLFFLFFFTIRQLIVESGKNENVWNYCILPFLFLSSGVMFSTLMPHGYLVQILIIIIFLFLNFYFRSIYEFLLKPNNYKKDSLENFSSYGNFLALYFFASSVYGFQSFLGIDVWSIMFFLLLVIILIVYQVFWANKILTKANLLYIIILPLVYIELAWSISFLTLSFYILGMILAVSYYIGIGIVRFYLIGKLDAQIIKMYLIFGFFSILTVILTARWI
ncbi:hypothetical protein KAU09_04530 [Candidatus Parcubacteria bacterium]|nr:hypothetical protein [Candidatus Parcubacteria bacterium]